MKCPVCGVPLQMTERQGVEIDYCPQCRGVWLDRGELDKILQRAGTPTRYDDDDDQGRGHEGHYRGRKKESFWGELFDFG